MTTKTKIDPKSERKEVEATLPPEPDQSKSTAVASGPRPRVTGRRAKPVYLIHDGGMELTIPAETREYIIQDVDDPHYGEVATETVIEEYTAKGRLPRGTRFGSRKINTVHEIWDKAEEQALRARGFREASDAEVKRETVKSLNTANIDYVAAKERDRAQDRLRRMGGARTARDDE